MTTYDAIDFQTLKASSQLPSPKGVMLNVIRLCQREQVSLPQLAKQIQSDPVLAGRIIKIANVLNPIKTRQIASITNDVLILVGIHSVRQVALGISLVTSYQSGACQAFDYAHFWSRSVAMACAAQALAARIRIAPVAEMFTCGLLAGIGRLGIATVRPEAYSRLLETHAGSSPEALLLTELQAFSLNHLSLAALMMSDWSIPRLFSDAVLFHETPQLSGYAEGSRQQRLVLLLNTAARIADLCMAGDAQREALLPAILEASSESGIGQAEMAAVINQTSLEWSDTGTVLRVKTRPLPVIDEAALA